MAVLYKFNEQGIRIDIPWKKGMKLIHKYRNVKPFYLDHFVKVYIFGYKDGTAHHFNFILPDGRIISSPEENVDLTLFNLK